MQREFVGGFGLLRTASEDMKAIVYHRKKCVDINLQQDKSGN